MTVDQTYIDIIKNGGVVAFPTETVYGLGADAWNAQAIQKIFEVKGRPSDNPLIVHISDIVQLDEFVDEIPDIARTLTQHFWPGPLTMIFPKKQQVLDIITAGLGTVAIRMPDHPTAIDFISRTGPLAAPSANTSGRPSPTKTTHVRHDFGADFPVIDGDFSRIGLESTVLDITGDTPVILRPGKIGASEIEQAIGQKVILDKAESQSAPKSPGQKYSHYKPKAKVVYGEISDLDKHTLYLTQNNSSGSTNVVCYNGDLKKLSRELFDQFRQADIQGYDRVHIEEIEDFKPSNPALYTALKNRIRKAVV
ncbi:MAG: threonylcarbamoyl-AMP synthase [Balneolaceae bacterium]|nr:threonylcarbamoyl-AMP synthase [Balneolaceae bacterium]